MATTASLHLRMIIPPGPWNRAMEDGSVQIPGVTWTCRTDIEHAPDRFDVAAAEAFDVGENGVRRLVLDVLKGEPPSAIPVFFGREHMQRNLIVRAESSLTHPRDLVGKRVGSRLTPYSGTGAGVKMMLARAYGIDLRSIHWYMGDPSSVPANPMNLDLHQGPSSDEEGFRMVLAGELDAVEVTTGSRHRSLFGGDVVDESLRPFPNLRPLITDPGIMADAYRRTGLYPITDLVTVSPRVAAHTTLARDLVDAFSRSNAMASRYRSAEEQQLAEREVAVLGDDPHQYGLGANQWANVAAFVDTLFKLGAIPRAPQLEELFVASSISAD